MKNNSKYHLDYNDSKKIKVNGIEYEVYRVIVDRDIKVSYLVEPILKGAKCGYIFPGTLSQKGDCLVVGESSIVGPGCFICGDALVDESVLLHDVRVEHSGAISYSKVNPTRATSVSGGAILVNSKINGNVFLSGEARLDSSSVEGELSMTDDAKIFSCNVIGVGEGLSLASEYSYSNKLIAGRGPINCSDDVTLKDNVGKNEMVK